jgi:DNA-binding MarR family transcriptional regulator
MGIEKEIAQRNFRNEYHKTAVNLIYTFHWLNERMNVIFEKHDITSQQFNILRILRGANKPLSTLQIRQLMLDKMSDTSRIVDRLLKKELVHKVTSSIDKRLVDVSITPKGMQLLEQLDTQQKEMDAIFNGLNDEEAKMLSDLLDKLRSGFHNDKY